MLQKTAGILMIKTVLHHITQITMDGSTYTLTSFNSSCTVDRVINSDSQTAKSYASLILDTKCKNGPNYFVGDVFALSITNNKAPFLYPKSYKYYNTRGQELLKVIIIGN